MTFIGRVAEALLRAGVDFAVAGGHAVALHGAVRGTVDLDLVLRWDRAQFIAAEGALKSLGLSPRLPVSGAQVYDFRKEYVEERNLVAWSFCNPLNPTELVDILITHDLAKMRTRRVRAEGLALPIVSVADLIAMKRKAGRPQDLEDIRALETL